MTPTTDPPGEGYVWVCSRFITLRNGKRLDALDYGKKAFCFWARSRRK